jgi:hypothetical protein
VVEFQHFARIQSGSGQHRSTILVLGLDSPAQADDRVREAGTEEMPEPPSASDSATSPPNR